MSDTLPETQKPQTDKEWRLIEKLLSSSLNEQRRTRRWGIFFKLLTFIYLFLIFYVFLMRPGSDAGMSLASKPHTALIEIDGVISASEDASADRIVGALREAFKEKAAKAIVLRINSPGGSPVQAGYVYDEIVRLQSEYPEKKVYAVIVDIGASGAYYIAAAANEIFADKASLVGSIGVTASGFGFVDSLEKLGVERRIFTAGDHKSFLDPFLPVNAEEVEIWQTVLDGTHKQFIEQVEKGRGERLSKDNPLLYSGIVWNGEQALSMGLVDGLGSSSYVAREVVGHENIVNYTVKPNPIDALVKRLGVSVGQGLAHFVRDNAIRLQ